MVSSSAMAGEAADVLRVLLQPCMVSALLAFDLGEQRLLLSGEDLDVQSPKHLLERRLDLEDFE